MNLKNLVPMFILAAALGLTGGCSTPPASAPKKAASLPILAPSTGYLELQGLAFQLAGVAPNPTTLSGAEMWVGGFRKEGGMGRIAWFRAEIRGRWDWTLEIYDQWGGYNHLRVDSLLKDRPTGRMPMLRLTQRHGLWDMEPIGPDTWALQLTDLDGLGQGKSPLGSNPTPKVIPELGYQKDFVALLRDAIQRGADERLGLLTRYDGTIIVPKGATAAVRKAAEARYAEVYGPAHRYTLEEAATLEQARVGAMEGADPWQNSPLIYGFSSLKP